MPSVSEAISTSLWDGRSINIFVLTRSSLRSRPSPVETHTTPLFEISAYWFCGTGTFLRFIGSEDRHISDYLDSHAEPAMHIRMAFAYPYCFPTPSLIYFRDCFQPHYFLHIYPSLITIQGPRIWGTKASPSPSRCLFWPCHDRELAYDLPKFIISLLFLLFSFGS